MHISVRHDIVYNFSSGMSKIIFENVENKKKTFFAAHFFKVFRPRPLMPFEKFQPLSYPNMSKWNIYLIFLFQEKYDYFLQYLG